MRAGPFRWIETVLFLAGFACLGASLWAVSERVWFQWRYRTWHTESPPAGKEPARTAPLGRIEIPRVGVSAVILDGVEEQTLRLGVGHLPGSAYPGASRGRIVLAAHRDTFFRNLRSVRAGDTVRLLAPGFTAVYLIERTEIVKPWQTEVVRADDDDVLTLLTCFPFNYVGEAPDRFVVHARRLKRDGSAQGVRLLAQP